MANLPSRAYHKDTNDQAMGKSWIVSALLFVSVPLATSQTIKFNTTSCARPSGVTSSRSWDACYMFVEPGATGLLQKNLATKWRKTLSSSSLSSGARTYPNGTAHTWGEIGQSKIATLTATLDAGQVRRGALIGFAIDNPGVTILYAVNSMPSCPSKGAAFTSPVAIGDNETISAIACKTGFAVSPVLILAFTVRNPQTFYVSSSTGDDSNDGTSSATPWSHVPGQAGCRATCAATTVVGGDHILLKAGDTWTTPLTIPRPGDPGANITLSFYGTGAKPYWTGSNSNVPIMVKDRNRGYWTVNGIKFHSTGAYPNISQALAIYHGDWLGSDPASDGPEPGWIVENCESDAAFWLTGPNTIVRSNILDGSDNDGRVTPNANHGADLGAIVISGVAARHAQIYGNEVRYWSGRGIWMEEGASYANIHDNYIHDLTSYEDPISICWCGQGIDLDGAGVPETGEKVYNNRIHHILGPGIALENVTQTRVWGNKIDDTRAAGISTVHYSGEYGTYIYTGVAANSVLRLNVISNAWECIRHTNEGYYTDVHNTCVGGYNSWAHTLVTDHGTDLYDGAPDANGYNLVGSFDHMTFIDNIVTRYACPMAANGTGWTQFDYNDLYGSTYILCGPNRTLAQTHALGYMLHGISRDPDFVNPTGGNFALSSKSPAEGTGVALTSPLDTVLTPSIAFPWALQLQGPEPNMGAFGHPR
jgi:hypothetical protein